MRLLNVIFACSVFVETLFFVSESYADIASVGYVDDKVVGTIYTATQTATDPTLVNQNTAVPSAAATYTFASNANNLTTGTVDTARLPVASTSAQGIVQIGTAATNAAAGNDQRFDTVSTAAPSGTPDTGRAFIWFQ